MTTFSAKPAEVVHEWFVIDATDKVLGRVASEVAPRPARQAQSHLHASRRHRLHRRRQRLQAQSDLAPSPWTRCTTVTRLSGGITATNFRDLQAKHPGRALEKAVMGMPPKGPSATP